MARIRPWIGDSCLSRNRDKFCHSRTGRGVVRQQAQEDFRADADSSAAETREEKIDGGEVADSEEKKCRESHSVRDAISECLCLSEKAKIFAESIAGIFFDCEQEEEEAQGIADSESNARRIAGSFGKPERDTASERNSEAHAIIVAFAEGEKKGRTCHHRG